MFNQVQISGKDLSEAKEKARVLLKVDSIDDFKFKIIGNHSDGSVVIKAFTLSKNSAESSKKINKKIILFTAIPIAVIVILLVSLICIAQKRETTITNNLVGEYFHCHDLSHVEKTKDTPYYFFDVRDTNINYTIYFLDDSHFELSKVGFYRYIDAKTKAVKGEDYDEKAIYSYEIKVSIFGKTTIIITDNDKGKTYDQPMNISKNKVQSFEGGSFVNYGTCTPGAGQNPTEDDIPSYSSANKPSGGSGSSYTSCSHASCKINGPFYCMGKNNTCTNKTYCCYDLYCDSCD